MPSGSLVPCLMQLARLVSEDPVPNVRFCAAKALNFISRNVDNNYKIKVGNLKSMLLRSMRLADSKHLTNELEQLTNIFLENNYPLGLIENNISLLRNIFSDGYHLVTDRQTETAIQKKATQPVYLVMVLTSLTLVQHVRLNSSTEPDVPDYAAPVMPFLGGMEPSSDDVHHMMDKSSARFHPKRGRSRGLHQPEGRIKAKRLQYNGIHPSSSGETDERISS
ncbi:unnamed protein product [Protopolystoma xenopodis]|uniref:Helix-turn-helix domain-containing protein n=1 Tax=Protopolystoma xenopodis TaxID=117903 RepID=A0A448XDA6_9PLAT|nr:unnamed protein product [Protopolystoma xenopodis]